MRSNESPATLFQIIASRREKRTGLRSSWLTATVLMALLFVVPAAPSIVIYDNACHLHEYFLNRDPALAMV